MITPKFRPRLRTDEIILHDLHSCGPIAHVEARLKVDGRKLGLLFPGYHFVVLLDGNFLQMRPLDAVGNHTQGYNQRSIGIALEGGRRVVTGEDGEERLVPADNFTGLQRAKVKWIIDEVITPVYGKLPISGHSECGRHAWQLGYPCPALDMDKFRESISQLP